MQTRGHVEIIIRERPHKLFKRDFKLANVKNPANLLLVINISFADAVLGLNYEFTHLDKRVLVAKYNDEIIKSEQIMVIPNEGMPLVNKSTKGDLYIQLLVSPPRTITEENKQKIWELFEGRKYVKSTSSKKAIPMETILLEDHKPQQNPFQQHQFQQNPFQQFQQQQNGFPQGFPNIFQQAGMNNIFEQSANANPNQCQTQ